MDSTIKFYFATNEYGGNPHFNMTNNTLQSNSDGVFAVRNYNNQSYSAMLAQDYLTGSDLRRKTNLELYEDDVLEKIKKSPVYRYSMIDDNEGINVIDGKGIGSAGSTEKYDPKLFGLIAQYVPDELVDSDEYGGLSIKQYAMNTYTWLGIQQLIEKNERLEQELQEIKKYLGLTPG